jgi:tetratricopeptide (TPR) repeat protein
MALTQLGRHAAALESFDRAAELEPSAPEVWLDRGETLGKMGRFDEALPYFDRVLTLAPTFAPAWFGKARVLANLGRFDEGAAACRKYLELADPQDHLRPTADALLALCEAPPPERDRKG